jgi:hypothetical protein
MSENLGFQLLKGITDEAWVKRMTEYHDKMVMDGVLSYPLIPFVKNKRIRPEVHMATGQLTIIFETHNVAAGTIVLTPEQFETFKSYAEDIMSFAISIRDKIPIEVPEGQTPNFGWNFKLLPIDENINVRLRWNVEQGTGLVTLMGLGKHFTMAAGSYIHFKNFICNKLTNAVRMWQVALSSTEILRASLASTFMPEKYFMNPQPVLQDPVEFETFQNDFFGKKIILDLA